MSNKDNKVTPLRMMPQLAQHAYRQLGVVVPAGCKRADLENPAFWLNVAQRLQAGDEIRCIEEHGSFVAYVIVTFVSGNDARCKVISFTELGAVPDQVEDDVYVVKNGGVTGFYIKDKRDGSRLFDRYYPSHKEAAQALEGHLKSLAA